MKSSNLSHPCLLFFLFWVIFTALQDASVSASHVVYTTQAFYLPITRNLFDNFARGEQLQYRVTMLNMPDLPWWMSYRHLNGSEQAYLYGAPDEPGDVNIEVIAMNTKTYDTSRQIINFQVQNRGKEAQFQVELKLLNLNVEDMFDGHRLRQVEEIFRDHLWRTSESVYITMVASAVDVGGRRPLNPKDKEGVVVRIGGTDNFTQDLYDLEREVLPLRKRFPCPKDYRRTTAEHLFRRRDLISDWCSFRLISPKNGHLFNQDHLEGFSTAILDAGNGNGKDCRPAHAQLPRRDFLMDFVVSIIVPTAIVLALLTSLSCAFYCHHEESKPGNKETRIRMAPFSSVNANPLTKPRCESNAMNNLGPREISPTISHAGSPNSTMPKGGILSCDSRTSTLRHGGLPQPPPYTPPRA